MSDSIDKSQDTTLHSAVKDIHLHLYTHADRVMSKNMLCQNILQLSAVNWVV